MDMTLHPTPWSLGPVYDTGQHRYCQYVEIVDARGDVVTKIEWTCGYSSTPDADLTHKSAKIATAKSIISAMNRAKSE